MRLRNPSAQARAVLSVFLSDPLQWRHGYDLAKMAALGSGTLYPLLIRLHGRGLLEAKWTEPERPGRPPRHAYRLTAEGLAYARDLAGRPEATERACPEALA
jgi:DNA-binding PadR family transcriptional regulator